MQKQTKYRYQSAAEMISDIEKFRNAPNLRFGYQFPAEDKKDKHTGRDNPRGNSANRRNPRGRGDTERDNHDRGDPAQRTVKTPFLPILTGVTLAFMLAAMAFVGLMLYISNPFVVVAEETMPNLIGIKFDTAQQQFDFFDIIVESEEFSNEYGLDIIFEQRPRPGTSIRVGSSVRVTISRGQEIVTLPNFAGVSASQTISKLIDLGLMVNEVRMFSDEVSAGRVVYTEPSRDSLVASGETVTVYVSNGPEVRLTSVPNLVGQNIDNATRLLEQRGLVLGEIIEVPSDWPSGTIVAHDPVEGDLQIEGTLVNVEVSSEGLRRHSIPIPMPPNIDRFVTIRAWTSTITDTDDKTMIEEDRINPFETHTWSPSFSGREGESIFVYVYIEGMLYHQYRLNFTDGGRILMFDRSGAEEFQR
jgi:serine/threonine-protein kinase